MVNVNACRLRRPPPIGMAKIEYLAIPNRIFFLNRIEYSNHVLLRLDYDMKYLRHNSLNILIYYLTSKNRNIV